MPTLTRRPPLLHALKRPDSQPHLCHDPAKADARPVRAVAKRNRTTNNQAELTAILQALQALTKPCSIQLYTDSQYAIGVLGKGFKRKSNLELLAHIDELAAIHRLTYHWVQGHAANRLNQRADELAHSALRQTHKEVH